MKRKLLEAIASSHARLLKELEMRPYVVIVTAEGKVVQVELCQTVLEYVHRE